MHAPADARLSAARLGLCQHSGSVPARHCWVSRLDRARHLTGRLRARPAVSASPAGRVCPKPPNVARWRPQTPELLLPAARSHGPDRAAAALGQGRHAGGRAGGQGAGGLPRRPRGPQDGGDSGLSPPRRPSGSLPSPPQPGPAAADGEARGRGTQRGRGSDARPGRGGGERSPSTPPPPAGPSPARARPSQPTFEFEV